MSVKCLFATHLERHFNHGHIAQQYLETEHQLVAIIASILDEFVEQRNYHGGAPIGRLWRGPVSEMKDGSWVTGHGCGLRAMCWGT